VHVLVTGGAGFLGSHVAREFVEYGYRVTVLDRVAPKSPLLRGIGFVQADLLDLNTLVNLLDGVEVVCHLAGVGDVYLAAAEPFTAATLNCVGTANIAEAARRTGVQKLVYASTWEVYGTPETDPVTEAHPCRPDHPYNITKYSGELLVLAYDRLHDLPAVALRLGTAFGPGMRPNSVFSTFIDRARVGEPIVIAGSGDQSRQFTHARDISAGFRLAAESPIRGKAINLTARERISIRQLAEMVVEQFPTEIRFGPMRTGDIHPATIDSSRARVLLGWEPQVRFRDGLLDLMGAAATHTVVQQPVASGVAASNGALIHG
jgi:UDP-glucose 4-epimerase